MKTSTNKLSQAIERMSSGCKVNHAKDNAANYSISTNMSTKISAYEIAESNTMMGLDMVATASENLSLIDDKLKRLRALAVQSLNGSYGTRSLEAINAEVNALVDEIDRIYSTSEYSGQKVFKNLAPPKIPDDIGTTGNVGVQTASTYSMRAANYGKFLDNPYTYEQSYVDSLTAVSSVVEADGFTESEYKVASVDDLKELARLTNLGVDTTGITFIMAKDLDIGAYCEEELAKGNGKGGWTPIGDTTNRFKGTFDGNGHVIKNLKINAVKNYQGLFGATNSSSEIKNVGLEGGSIKGEINCGGLVAESYSSITNCYAAVDVKCAYVCGGLVGKSYSSISNSHATGNITVGSHVAGGLAGSVSSSSITNCYATGNVTAGKYQIGGLIGSVDSSSISNSYATGNVSGSYTVGGLVGRSNVASSITNSYATGNVSGSYNVGGLVGSYKAYSSHSISNSYATGNVTGTSHSIGGLVGSTTYSPTINNSYATGDVTGGSHSVGGLVGNTASSISNCYATGAVSGESFVGGLIGQAKKTSGTQNITNCLTYSTVNGTDLNSTGSLIGGTVVTADNTTFGTINVTGCTSTSQKFGTLGGSYMYDSTNYTLLNNYDTSGITAGISLYVPQVTSLTLQVGANASDSSQITFDMAFILDNLDDLRQIGLNTTADTLSLCDNLIAIVTDKQTLYGAVTNRLESVLDEISTQYENLVSSRSTIRDADMAELSSTYVQQQILQDASATLMATSQNLRAESLLGLIQSINR